MIVILYNIGYLIWKNLCIKFIPKLMGDNNIDIMSDKKDKLQESLISLTTNIQLNQIIKESTRVRNTSETLIDQIYVSDDLPVLYSSPISIVLAIISLYFLFLK